MGNGRLTEYKRSDIGFYSKIDDNHVTTRGGGIEQNGA